MDRYQFTGREEASRDRDYHIDKYNIVDEKGDPVMESDGRTPVTVERQVPKRVGKTAKQNRKVASKT